MVKQYIHNVLIAIDEFFSALTGGDPQETISSRVGKAANSGSRLGHILRAIIDEIFGPTHCQDSIEPDEGKDKVAKY